MALTAQDDTGLVVGANAYITVAQFKAYHDDRGGDYSAYADPAIAQGIVRATAFVDVRFLYTGSRLNVESDQRTQFPRLDLFNSDGDLVEGLPQRVMDATAEYALRALAAPLFTDLPTPAGGLYVKSTSDKVGEIESSVTYEDSGVEYLIPCYPIADRMLADFVRSGNRVDR